VSNRGWPGKNRAMTVTPTHDPLVSAQIGVLFGASVGIHKVGENEDASEVANQCLERG
jgi:hypothetical protein